MSKQGKELIVAMKEAIIASLTPAQREYLTLLVEKERDTWINYPPAKTLVELELAEWSPFAVTRNKHRALRITLHGRQVLGVA